MNGGEITKDVATGGSEQLQRYSELTSWIRELSSPQLKDTDDAELYRLTLIRNFTRIGELSRLNRDILDDYYYPLLQSEDPLSEESIEAMRQFARTLLNAYKMETLDLPMIYLQSGRLLKDAERKADTGMILRALDDVVISAYTMMHMTYRLTPCFDVCFKYRDIGFAAAERILEHLPPERFEKLPDEETKEIVLINSRYIGTLFERGDALGDDKVNSSDLEILERSLSLADDPFYQENAKEYNWVYHTFRTLEYISSLISFGNLRGYDHEKAVRICAHAKALSKLWDREQPYLSKYSTQGIIDLNLARARYIAGEIDVAQYKDALLKISRKREDNNFSFHSTMINLMVPLEYIIVLDAEHLTRSEEQILNGFYRRMISYVHRMPKLGSLTYILTFLADILKRFIEVPGGMDFEAICLELMAALHPQTYVHTLNVADISVCLTRHLIRTQPEIFADYTGLTDKDAIRAKEKDIVHYIYHAALLHDVGKLFIMENILTYERDLFTQEFDLIRAHPVFGAYMLGRYPGTQQYAPVARGHHRYYDCSGGYPESSDVTKLKERNLIAIVTCADCLDAATDSVGRSYKKGKTFDAVLAELKDGAGARYAPWLLTLLEDEEVRSDLSEMLTSGREKNYRNTYHVLETL